MHIILSILLIAGAVVFGFAKPLHMPETSAMIIAVVALASAVWISLFAYRRKPSDERETLHRAISFQWATMVGALVLALGAVIQLSMHELDPWLVYSAAAMGVARMLSHAYLDGHS